MQYCFSNARILKSWCAIWRRTIASSLRTSTCARSYVSEQCAAVWRASDEFEEKFHVLRYSRHLHRWVRDHIRCGFSCSHTWRRRFSCGKSWLTSVPSSSTRSKTWSLTTARRCRRTCSTRRNSTTSPSSSASRSTSDATYSQLVLSTGALPAARQRGLWTDGCYTCCWWVCKQMMPTQLTSSWYGPHMT